ncbi:MAG: hypothetical protein QOE12_1274, partial [Mycobacterium sp.]|nr:hypothetical protein [Mycobacterium sp.]
VFQEVCGAGHGGTLVTRSDAYPYPYRRGAHRGQVFGDNPQAAGECGAPERRGRLRAVPAAA